MTLTLATYGRAREHFAAVLLEHQDLVDADFLARLGLDLIDGDDVARRHLDLATTALNDCEHGRTPAPETHLAASVAASTKELG